MNIELGVALVIAFIAAVTSIVSAFISYQSARKNAEKPADLQLANYRREWIENLRTKIAKFLALKFEEKTLLELRDYEKSKRNVQGATEYQMQVNEVMAQYGNIRFELGLSLNMDEVDHKKLDDELDRIFLTTESREVVFDHEFLSLCRKVLKAEWVVLKSEMKNL